MKKNKICIDIVRSKRNPDMVKWWQYEMNLCQIQVKRFQRKTRDDPDKAKMWQDLTESWQTEKKKCQAMLKINQDRVKLLQ